MKIDASLLETRLVDLSIYDPAIFAGEPTQALERLFDKLDEDDVLRTRLLAGTPLHEWLSRTYRDGIHSWRAIACLKRQATLLAANWSRAAIGLYGLPTLIARFLAQAWEYRQVRLEALKDAVGDFRVPVGDEQWKRLEEILEDQVQWIDGLVAAMTEANAEETVRQAGKLVRESSATDQLDQTRCLEYYHDALFYLWTFQNGRFVWLPTHRDRTGEIERGWLGLWQIVQAMLDHHPQDQRFLDLLLEAYGYDLAAVLQPPLPDEATMHASPVRRRSRKATLDAIRRRLLGVVTFTNEDFPRIPRSTDLMQVWTAQGLEGAERRASQAIEAAWLWSWQLPGWFARPQRVTATPLNPDGGDRGHVRWGVYYPRLALETNGRYAKVYWAEEPADTDPRPRESAHRTLARLRVLDSGYHKRNELLHVALEQCGDEQKATFQELDRAFGTSPGNEAPARGLTLAAFGGFGCLAWLESSGPSPLYQDCAEKARAFLSHGTGVREASQREYASTIEPRLAYEAHGALNHALRLQRD